MGWRPPGLVPRAHRRHGLSITTYRVGPDGTRHDRTPALDIDVDPGDPVAYHPAQGWPLCGCARCRADETRPPVTAG
ncbi:hypothetical protein [Kitasatospora sp. NPDC059599]|uniref:hypothetical protein n=1 Tax=Kitasatospora sp. NPDC059599 TaxID=3346880 RepID=UPI0036C1C06D